jgi:hypothetical protein
MSQERQQRRKEQAAIAAGARPMTRQRRAIYAVLIVAAFCLVYYLGTRSRNVRYIQTLLGQRKYDTFAQCLSDRGVKFYGAWWCPHCTEQKEEFGASLDQVPYIECGVKGDTHAKTQVCKDAGITHYPTWQFPPLGERVERVFTLEELRDRTGCSLP